VLSLCYQTVSTHDAEGNVNTQELPLVAEGLNLFYLRGRLVSPADVQVQVSPTLVQLYRAMDLVEHGADTLTEAELKREELTLANLITRVDSWVAHSSLWFSHFEEVREVVLEHFFELRRRGTITGGADPGADPKQRCSLRDRTSSCSHIAAKRQAYSAEFSK
jgi:hypothetical protein